MAKIVLASFALFLMHSALAQMGPPDAAIWLTAGAGVLMLLYASLVRI
jgi:hypothetical protein